MRNLLRSRRALVLGASLLWACGTREGGQDAVSPVGLGGPSRFGERLGRGDLFSEEPRDISDAAVREHVPYDRAIQKSSHNAYAKFEPIFDQLLWHGIRSVELDVHTRKRGRRAAPGDWFVFHEDYPFMRRSSCQQLSDCLGQLAAFHTAVPQHEPVTLWIDLKDDVGGDHGARALDALLASRLGRDTLVTPATLVTRCAGATSARDAVTREGCGFPTLGELRGKFVVAVTGGSDCAASSDNPLRRYRGDAPGERLAFVAPDADAHCPVRTYDQQGHVVFLNMAFGHRGQAAEVRERGLVARVFGGGMRGGLNTARDFDAARRTGAQHLATDRVNASSALWATTEGLREAAAPTEHVLDLRATTGDLWGASDSTWFSYVDEDRDASYHTFVSVPSSHAEPYAKACLMARASERADAPNVAVCRTFDNHPPRMQIRRTRGGATTSIELAKGGGLSSESPAFFRLAVRTVGAETEVTTEASVNGTDWRAVGRARIPGPLPLRGLALSSHGRSSARALFGELVRTRDGVSEPIAFGRQLAIGDGARSGTPLLVAERR